MVFKSGGRAAKNERWSWKGEEIEKVKTFKYLGYMFQSNNGRESHLHLLKRKAEVAIRGVWGVGERKFAGEIGLRWKLYEVLVNSILMYGVELWGWKRWEGLETVRAKYTRWVLGMKWNTPKYIVMEETGEQKDCSVAMVRAYNYEDKQRQLREGRWVKECVKWKRSRQMGEQQTRWRKEKQGALREIGMTEMEIEIQEQLGHRVQEDLTRRIIDNDMQYRDLKISQSKFNPFYKDIRPEGKVVWQSRMHLSFRTVLHPIQSPHHQSPSTTIQNILAKFPDFMFILYNENYIWKDAGPASGM